jgi:hypothetical protein
MRWTRFALVLLVLAAPAALAAQAAPGERAAAPPLRLPAALYDVRGVWELGWGDAPGRGRPTVRAAAATETAVVGPNRAARRAPPTPIGEQALSQFMIRVDSIVYRRGSDVAEIAVANITSIEEVRWPEKNQRSWIKVTWVARGIEQTMHFQQANASSQATLLATFRHAVELNRESASR